MPGSPGFGSTVRLLDEKRERAMTLPDRVHGHVVYPETDGEPMAETDTHRTLMMDLLYELSD